MGKSITCSSLGYKPEPDLYCGCRTDKIREAARSIREQGDNVPGALGVGIIGADKLAHCYAYCVAAYWWYVPVAFYSWTGVTADDAEDVAANQAGFDLGKGKRLFGNPCSCLKDCATATYNMPFQ
jgi:hypothetical protein